MWRVCILSTQKYKDIYGFIFILYPELEGTHNSWTQKRPHKVQTLCQSALNSGTRGHALRPGQPVLCPLLSGTDLVPEPQLPLPDVPPCCPSGPVAVTESRGQYCLSAPCEELQPSWCLPSDSSFG